MSYIARLIRVPQHEKLVKRPLDGLDPLLLALGGIFVGKGQGVDVWPVGEMIEV